MPADPVAERSARQETPANYRQVADPASERACVDEVDGEASAGVDLIAVLIALAVLVGLVTLMFYALPAWFGTSSVNVIIRS